MINRMNRLPSFQFGKVACIFLSLVVLTISDIHAYAFQTPSKSKISLENGKIRLEFDEKNGAFLQLIDLERNEVVANSDAPGSDSPWEIHYLSNGAGGDAIDYKACRSF